MTADNLFAPGAANLPAEAVDLLAAANGTRIERIVSRGHCSPPGFWYDQQQHEWVTVLTGAATIRFERDGRVVQLSPGDHLNIPAHERHRVEWTADDTETIWLAVFY